MNLFRKLWSDRRGATAIEYGLMVALIAVAAITALQSLGPEISTTFNAVDQGMASGNAAV